MGHTRIDFDLLGTRSKKMLVAIRTVRYENNGLNSDRRACSDRLSAFATSVSVWAANFPARKCCPTWISAHRSGSANETGRLQGVMSALINAVSAEPNLSQMLLLSPHSCHASGIKSRNASSSQGDHGKAMHLKWHRLSANHFPMPLGSSA